MRQPLTMHTLLSVHNYVLCATRRPRSDKSDKIECHALNAQSRTKKHFSVYAVSFTPPPPPLFEVKKKKKSQKKKSWYGKQNSPPPPPPTTPCFAQCRLCSMSTVAGIVIKIPQDRNVSWRKFSLSAFWRIFFLVSN